jgi:hypothetical protein
MSVSMYRGQADSLIKEIADLESKQANERGKAVRERGEAQRALSGIYASSSASTVLSKQRDAQRHEESAVKYDKEAARLAARIADKRRSLASAEASLKRALEEERKKEERESRRRRDEEVRHVQELERRRRALQQPLLQEITLRQPAATDGHTNEARDISGHEYDVCLSFAGEDRPYVEMVARGLKDKEVRVFYDHDEAAELWGKDLAEHFDWVYRKASRYCVMFISSSYAAKVWTRHERRSALARAITESYEYILPARFDETDLPGLQPTIAYIDLREVAPATLIEYLLEKLGKTADAR